MHEGRLRSCFRVDATWSNRSQPVASTRLAPRCQLRATQEPGRVYTQSYQNPALCLEQAPLRPPTGTRSSPTRTTSTNTPTL